MRTIINSLVWFRSQFTQVYRPGVNGWARIRLPFGGPDAQRVSSIRTGYWGPELYFERVR